MVKTMYLRVVALLAILGLGVAECRSQTLLSSVIGGPIVFSNGHFGVTFGTASGTVRDGAAAVAAEQAAATAAASAQTTANTAVAAAASAQTTANSASGGSSGTPSTTISASGTAQTLTFPSVGSKAYDITKTGNVVFTLTGGTAGQYEQITVIVRPGSGGFTETLPTGVLWSGGVAPTPSTTTPNVYVLSTPDAGVTVFGSY